MRDQEDKSEDRGGKVRASEREEVGSQISKFHSLFGGKSSIPLDSMAIPSFKFILIEKRKQKKIILLGHLPPFQYQTRCHWPGPPCTDSDRCLTNLTLGYTRWRTGDETFLLGYVQLRLRRHSPRRYGAVWAAICP